MDATASKTSQLGVISDDSELLPIPETDDTTPLTTRSRYHGRQLGVSPGISSWVLLGASVMWCTLTLIYAFESAVVHRNLAVPGEWLTGILSTLALVSGYLLSQLVVTVFENERWTLACQPSGIEMNVFLSMSKATELLGPICGLALDRKELRVRLRTFFWRHRKAMQR